MIDKPIILRGGRVQADAHKPPQPQDILIGTDGRISALLPPGTPAQGALPQDIGDKLVVPGLMDAHQHLDKSRTISRVDNPRGDLEGAVLAFRRYAAGMSRADIVTRAEQTIAACSARGTVAIRSHTNLDPESGTRGIEALIELRERWRDRLRLQVVAFASGVPPDGADADDLLAAGVALGADVIGGTPARAADARSFINLLFATAEKSGLRLDLHLDEHLDPQRLHFDAVIERTRALGMQGRVVVSHSSALFALPAAQALPIIDGLAAAGIGAITLPAANLFLQGRGADLLPPRGLTRVNDLARAGVTVACASDNIQDPFVPTGSGDMLEIARWTMLAAHLGSHELARAFDMASIHPAVLMGYEADYGIRVGARADLLITDAEDAASLVAAGALERGVLFGGTVVAGRRWLAGG